MAKTMLASVQLISDGQIENVVSKLRDALRKHRSDFPSDATQQVLGVENLGMELLLPFCNRVEVISNMIVRHVIVDRSRSPQKAIDATGRIKYLDDEVVKTMPRGEGDEVDVYFFKPRKSAYDKNGNISDDNLTKEYDFFGLKPDPYAQAAVNEADPAFADDYPNITHWKNKDGKWCYASLGRWPDERRVNVYRHDFGWIDVWWFSGVRK